MTMGVRDMGTMQRRRRYFREYAGLVKPKLTARPDIPLRDHEIAAIAVWDARRFWVVRGLRRFGVAVYCAVAGIRELSAGLGQVASAFETLNACEPVEVAP